MTGRRLIILLDGSSNRAAGPSDDLQTNVFRLNRAITYGFSGVPQIVFYFAGVGTRGDPLSAATGRGFDDIIIEAYVNLASNYMDGDEIYLFGFSRGAAAARALSGMISDAGLLWGDALGLFPLVWRYFLGAVDLGAGKREQLREKIQDKVVRPKIMFLGAFDTVAGSSWDIGKLFTKTRFQGLNLDESVEKAVHILSIDDNRYPSFAPLVWSDVARDDQVLEQIWMPGVHADVGGCSDATFIGIMSLLTMLDRISAHTGIELDLSYINSIKDDASRMKKLVVSSERPDLIRSFLHKGMRQIVSTKTSFIHPLYNAMKDKPINIRGKMRSYRPPNVPTQMPAAKLRDQVYFENAINRVLAE